MLRLAGRVELRQEEGGTDDRAGDELRKEGQVEQHVGQPAAYRDIASVDIHDIGDAMEGEERDADGKDDLDERQFMGQAEAVGRPLTDPTKKSKYLNVPRMHRWTATATATIRLPAAIGGAGGDQEARGEGEHGAAGQQQAEPPVPLRVEDVAGEHQDELARLMAAGAAAPSRRRQR